MMLFPRFHVKIVHTMLLRFTSCALNGPPLGIQDQSQKKKYNCGSDDGIKNFQTQSQRHMPVQKCVPVLVKFHPSDLTPMLYIHHGPFPKVSR